MGKSLDKVSQEFKKFLVEVIYERHHYFTVWGTDTTDEELDKWLVDKDRCILVFNDIQTLRNSLALGSNFFDDEKIKQWVRHLDNHSSPSNIFDFDLLILNADEIYDSVRDLYYLTGLIEDFAIQIGDEKMMGLFKSDLFMEFKDEAANCFLWEGQNEFNKDLNFIRLSEEFHSLHKDLRGKISFPSL